MRERLVDSLGLDEPRSSHDSVETGLGNQPKDLAALGAVAVDVAAQTGNLRAGIRDSRHDGPDALLGDVPAGEDHDRLGRRPLPGPCRPCVLTFEQHGLEPPLPADGARGAAKNRMPAGGRANRALWIRQPSLPRVGPRYDSQYSRVQTSCQSTKILNSCRRRAAAAARSEK